MSRDTTKPTKWLCAQRRLRSAWASPQSDQSLRCPHEESLDSYLPTERTAKTLIRLGGCPGWSESSLGAQSFCWFCHEAAHICSYAKRAWTSANDKKRRRRRRRKKKKKRCTTGPSQPVAGNISNSCSFSPQTDFTLLCKIPEICIPFLKSRCVRACVCTYVEPWVCKRCGMLLKWQWFGTWRPKTILRSVYLSASFIAQRHQSQAL